MRIVVDQIDPPVPSAAFDFCAYDADTYDGADDAGVMARIVGYGRTREEAILDFKAQWAEARGE
jgi:hypothetical protein